MLANILSGVVVGVIVFALAAVFRRHRIYSVSPRLLGHSELSETAHVLEITVWNRGIATEEDIRITLNPRCTYDLLAASTHDAALAEKVVTIPRLVPEGEFTVLLQAEGPSIADERIVRAESKASKVRVVDKYEEVGLSTWVLSVVFALLVGISLAGYLWFSDYRSEELRASSEPNATLPRMPGEIPPELEAPLAAYRALGWSVSPRFLEDDMHKSYAQGELPVRVLPHKRVKDSLEIPLLLANQTDELMEVRGALLSPAGEGPGINTEDSFSSIALFPHMTSEQRLVAFLPKQFKPHILRVEVSIEWKSHYYEFSYEWKGETQG